MPVRFVYPVIALFFLSMVTFCTVGCGDEVNDEAAVATEEQGAEREAADEPAQPPDAMVEEPEPEPDPAIAPEDESAQTDEADVDSAESDAESERVAVDDERADWHVGAWLVQGERHSNSMFIFTPDGRAQAGTEMLMLNGEYTVDFDHEMPFLHVRLDVMGRTVEQKSFIEYVSEDQLRLHTVTEDPDAPGEYVKVDPPRVMLLTRDE